MSEPEWKARPWDNPQAPVDSTPTLGPENPPSQPSGPPDKRPGCLWYVGGIALIFFLIGQCSGGSGSDPCREASDARAIANASTGQDRQTALLQAATKQAQCDAKRRSGS